MMSLSEKVQEMAANFRNAERSKIISRSRSLNYLPESDKHELSHIFYSQSGKAFEIEIENSNELISEENDTSISIEQIEQPKEKDIFLMGDFKFHLHDTIGQGAYSKVYKGINSFKQEMIVAIKQLNVREQGLQKVEIEINNLKNIHSENVVQLYDYAFDRVNGMCYLILEFCNQGPLSNHVENLKITDAIQIFQQILNGMKALQEKMIIHRDLKLDNILIHNGVVKIGDFGFSRVMLSDFIQSGRCGTPETMAPEIYFSEDVTQVYTDKTDVWALGIILYQLIYKRHPFDYKMESILTGRTVRIEGIDQVVDDFLLKSLEINYMKRMSLKDCLNHELYTYKYTEKKKDNNIPTAFLIQIIMILLTLYTIGIYLN